MIAVHPPAARFGYVPKPQQTKQFVKGLEYPSLPKRVLKFADEPQRDVSVHWDALAKVSPSYRRGNQALGSCVGWGAELGCTFLIALMANEGLCEFTEAATEAIYGGCRVEIADRQMGNEDGAAGSWAAEWLQKYGVLLRKDYSQETGNPEHDLRKYSGKKEKNWGYYGCGGQNDQSKLDAVAKLYPVKAVTPCRNMQEYIAGTYAGCVCTIASDAGFGRGDMDPVAHRNQDGVCNITDNWMHQMIVCGLKWINGIAHGRIFQSWGMRAADGPDPHVTWPTISGFSWWAPEKALNYIFKQDDSFLLSHIQNFARAPYDFSTGLLV